MRRCARVMLLLCVTIVDIVCGYAYNLVLTHMHVQAHTHTYTCINAHTYALALINNLIIFVRYDDLCHSPRANGVNPMSTTNLVHSQSSDLKKRQAPNCFSVQGTFLYLFV